MGGMGWGRSIGWAWLACAPRRLTSPHSTTTHPPNLELNTRTHTGCWSFFLNAIGCGCFVLGPCARAGFVCSAGAEFEPPWACRVGHTYALSLSQYSPNSKHTNTTACIRQQATWPTTWATTGGSTAAGKRCGMHLSFPSPAAARSIKASASAFGGWVGSTTRDPPTTTHPLTKPTTHILPETPASRRRPP